MLSVAVAGQTPKWSPKTRREYHAVTRGWIVNEVVVRCDPEQRTIGQFVQAEIMQPLGMEGDFNIGLGLLSESEKARAVPLQGNPTGSVWGAMQSLLPPSWQIVGV